MSNLGRVEGWVVSDVDVVFVAFEDEGKHGRGTSGDVDEVACCIGGVGSGTSTNGGEERSMVGIWVRPVGGFAHDVRVESAGHGEVSEMQKPTAGAIGLRSKLFVSLSARLIVEIMRRGSDEIGWVGSFDLLGVGLSMAEWILHTVLVEHEMTACA